MSNPLGRVDLRLTTPVVLCVVFRITPTTSESEIVEWRSAVAVSDDGDAEVVGDNGLPTTVFCPLLLTAFDCTEGPRSMVSETGFLSLSKLPIC